MKRYSLLSALTLVGVAVLLAATRAHAGSEPDLNALLARLEKTSNTRIAPIAADELALFEDARDGKLDRVSFAEAALLASGVSDPARRRAYLARIDSLEEQARNATAEAKTPSEKADRLLQWMHGGVFRAKSGYKTLDSDLVAVLDQGTYNCLSSSVLYNVIGCRVGLSLRAVETSDHVYPVLRDGDKRVSVQTTNKAGFNRDWKATKNQREVGEIGLVAAVYNNEVAERIRDKRFAEAVRAAFCAVGVEPSRSRRQNAHAVFCKWSAALVRDKRFEEAVAVAAIGMEFAGADKEMKRLVAVRWNDWAMTFMKQQEWARAKEILDRGLEQVNDVTLSHNRKVCLQRLDGPRQASTQRQASTRNTR